MKYLKRTIIVLLISGALGYPAWYFYERSKKPDEEIKTEKPTKKDIAIKIIAAGAIEPREEIKLVPRVSGVIDKIYVEPGEIVKKGQKIAKIKIIPRMSELNRADADLKSATINYKNAELELKRAQQLITDSLISLADFQAIRRDFQLTSNNLEASKENLKIIKEGITSNAANNTTMVFSTIGGMILEIPEKEGASVIETNTFNEGTIIATVADMKDLIFKGKIDESEVEKIKQGMPLTVKIGAIDSISFDGHLEYISPKGIEEEGAIQFEIRANVNQKSDMFIRAGYSANAEIILNKKDSVLAINESLVTYSEDSIYVLVKISETEFEKRLIKTGLSDGIFTEVTEGLSINDEIKKQ